MNYAKVLCPISITDSMFVASNVDEPEQVSPPWVTGTTYAIGDIRSRVTTQRRYRRLTAGAGATPPESDPTNWIDVGAEPVGLKWLTGTTYVVGDLRIDAGRTYRRLIAGAGATAPALDATNWLDVGPAPTEIAWVPTETYAIGDRRIRGTTHKVYIATASGVDAGLPESTPLRWFDNDEPTNKWAAFDSYSSTVMTKTGTLTLTVKPGIITDMAFYGLVGDTLRVVCKNTSSLAVYLDQTYSLSDYLSGDLMWEFYFGTPRQRDRLDITGLVPTDAQVEVTITPSSVTGTAGIGIFALGSFEPIGLPLEGFKVQLVDYSRIKVDEDGKIRIKKGLNAKNLSGECVNISALDAQVVVEVFERMLGTPCAWVMSSKNNYQYLSAFGLGSADFTAYTNYGTLSLTVRGTI